MMIRDGCVVAIHYTLRSDAGDVIDSSEGREPLEYLHGVGMLVPGLERELSEKSTGDAFQVVVQPAEGYGEVDPTLIDQVERSLLADIEDLEVGIQLEARGPEGESHTVTVRELTDTHAVLDANAPLAGEVLHFDIQIEAVREATSEELDHGHSH